MSKKCDKHGYDKFEKIKARHACIKDLKSKDIKTETIQGVTGSFQDLTSDNATFTNLNATTINGVDANCNPTFNGAGVITPVVYENGEPQPPDNPSNINPLVLDELWTFNKLANLFTNLDSESGRLRSAILNKFYNCDNICPAYNLSDCECPTGPTGGYAVFEGEIESNGSTGATGTILKVTNIKNESLIDGCPDTKGIIGTDQRIFIKDVQYPSSTIVSQISGATGSTGSYLIKNDFNNYSSSVVSPNMLSLSDSGFEDCVNVPMRIYGVETLSATDFSSSCGSIMSTISYNLNIVNRSATPKIAAVYVQVGYLEPGLNSTVAIKGIEIDTRQFKPSILSFGEQMNNTVILPTALMEMVASANFPGIVNGVVQLAVYVEDGMDVLIPDSNEGEVASRNVTEIIPSTTNYATNFVSSASLDSSLVETFTVPPKAKTLTYNIFGGGGGGGNGDATSSGGGGGGGSGFDLGGENSYSGPQTIDLTTSGNDVRKITVRKGRGGKGGEARFFGADGARGGITTITLDGPGFSGTNTATGGFGGKSGSFRRGPDGPIPGGLGGRGAYGGGGGSPEGKGGMGTADAGSCQNGSDASEKFSGSGGAPKASNGTCLPGGSGLENFRIAGGGGGGGFGGGDGGGEDSEGFSSLSTSPIRPSAGGGGGGGGITLTRGTDGADGYIDGPHYTF